MDRFSVEEVLKHSAGLSAEAMELLANYAGLSLFNIHIPTGEIQMNRNTAQFTGYEPGELPHSENTKEMLTFEDDRPKVRQCMAAVMAGESDHYHLEYRMRRRDGSTVSIAEYGMVYERDAEGRPVRFAALGEDLSRLRWAEEKARNMEKENRRLALGATEGELADQNRMLRAANTAATMLIGGFHQDYETMLRQALQILGESVQAEHVYIWRNTEIDGRICCFLRAQWDQVDASANHENTTLCYDEFLPRWGTQSTGKEPVLSLVKDLDEGILKMPDIQSAKSVMMIPLLLHGEFWGFICFTSNSAERLYTESEADAIGSGALVIASSVSRNETFGKLNEAREAAMASTKAKGEFLSRMSHEIRTPMNAIIGMTSIAKKTDDPERIRYYLDKVDASSRQLLGIINDVLDMSKIDANKFEIVNDAFDFEKMMQNVFNVLQVKLEEKHQPFVFDLNKAFTRKVVSDELRLSQVLLNLLSNAIKFTPDKGKITLKVRQEPRGDERFLLRAEVIDTGIGIDPQQQARLFDSFEQADGSITRQYGGSGLGLAICKKIIELMGGRIWVESAPGQGSSFIFEVEMSWGDKLPARSGEESLPASMSILVVDDSEDVREYFRNILNSFSLQCDTAADGDEALAAAQKSLDEGRPYDMVFIDWNMPGMNGGNTARALRRLIGEDAVVVMISVADWADIEKGARKAGVQHFLPKPVLPSVLYNTIVALTDNTLVAEQVVEEATRKNWEDKTILLAEDIEINQEIIKSVLEDTRVELVYAMDGVEAVAAFEKEPERYDLILMDMQMPNMDGLDATRHIRDLGVPWAKEVPIVAMTANAFKEDEQLCLSAGMNAHLAKPLDIDLMFKVLGKYLD